MADMSNTDKTQQEAETAEKLEELIAKLVRGDASPEDVACLQALSAAKARRLVPPSPQPPFAGFRTARRRFA